jgi:hypothetical protein
MKDSGAHAQNIEERDISWPVCQLESIEAAINDHESVLQTRSSSHHMLMRGSTNCLQHTKTSSHAKLTWQVGRGRGCTRNDVSPERDGGFTGKHIMREKQSS